MKFSHVFSLISADKATYLFGSEKNRVRLDFIKEGIRVAVFKEGDYLFPTFSIAPNGIVPEAGRDKLSIEGFDLVEPAFVETENSFEFTFGSIKIAIKKLNFEMCYFKDGAFLFKDREYLAYNFDHEFGQESYHFISRDENELIFGLGDKTGDINKNKRSFRLSTSDAMGFDARSSDPLYKHIPFYICSNNSGSYGIYYDTYSQGEFDFGREINNYYNPFKSFRCEEETMVFYVFFGKIPEILVNYKSLCGHDFFPQEWTLKYCGSTMEYTDSPNADEKLRKFVNKCEDYGLDCGGFYLSSGYTQIGDKRCVFHWNRDKIPSPEGLAEFFVSHGINFLPNVKPCFLTDHPLYETIAKLGYFLKDKSGNAALFPFWSGKGSYLDFTNPDAARFWSECVKRELVDRGYLYSWNDNNEYDIHDDETMAYGFGHPVKAKLIRPLFSYLMTRASLSAQKEDLRKVAVSRSGIVGTSRIASTWTGDNRTSFEDFRYNHKMAMTMSLSGIYNFGQDIGGFAGPVPSKELFLRWIQYGIFTPRFVLHSWNSVGPSNMPWLYPEEKETVQRLFGLRSKLVSYLYQEVYRSTLDNRPIVYPIFLNYPGYDVESDAYFFGDSIIALPIFDEGKTEATIDLPVNNGGWYFRGKRVEGKQTLPCTIHDDPIYFIKGGSAVFYGNYIEIYSLDSGEFESEFLIDDGKSPLKEDNHEIALLRVKCNENEIRINLQAKKKLDVRLIDSKHRAMIIE